MQTLALKALITQVKQDTGIMIVKANQEGAVQPPLPYAVYNVTSPYVKGKGRGSFTLEGDTETFTEQPLATISFNVYADDVDEAREKAIQLRNWFIFAGNLYMQDHDIAVRSAGNIENRTTHLVDHYEYKHGFDVQLRTVSMQTRTLEYIETVNIQEG